MRPIRFPEVNKTLKPPMGHEASVKDLPVWTNNDMVASCWRLSFWERIRALIFGRVWLQVLTHKGTQPPVAMSCYRSIFE